MLESFKNLGSIENCLVLGINFGEERFTMDFYFSSISSAVNMAHFVKISTKESFRGGFRTVLTSKLEHFVIIVTNGF